jgi:hypothetical protein
MMGVDYKGHQTTGYLTKITNAVDGKKYNVSTVLKASGPMVHWETSVSKQGFFGAFLKPLLSVHSMEENDARWAHEQMEGIVEQQNPMDWKRAQYMLIWQKLRRAHGVSNS